MLITFATFSAFVLFGPAAVRMFDTFRAQAERGAVLEEAVPTQAPSRAGDEEFARWLGRYGRVAIGGASATFERYQRIDIRAALPDVTVPVLALRRGHDRFVPAENADYIAAHVRNGRAVILPGSDDLLWAGDVDVVAGHVEPVLATLPGT